MRAHVIGDLAQGRGDIGLESGHAFAERRCEVREEGRPLIRIGADHDRHVGLFASLEDRGHLVAKNLAVDDAERTGERRIGQEGREDVVGGERSEGGQRGVAVLAGERCREFRARGFGGVPGRRCPVPERHGAECAAALADDPMEEAPR